MLEPTRLTGLGSILTLIIVTRIFKYDVSQHDTRILSRPLRCWNSLNSFIVWCSDDLKQGRGSSSCVPQPKKEKKKISSNIRRRIWGTQTHSWDSKFDKSKQQTTNNKQITFSNQVNDVTLLSNCRTRILDMIFIKIPSKLIFLLNHKKCGFF